MPWLSREAAAAKDIWQLGVPRALYKKYTQRRKPSAYHGYRRAITAPRTRMTRIPRDPVFLHEKKFYDNYKVDFAIPASSDWTGTEADPATYLTFTAPAQDSTSQGRVGRRISLQTLHIRGCVRTLEAEAQVKLLEGRIYNISIVLDTETNGAQLNGEDVFSNETGVGTVYNTIAPMRKMDGVVRYKVLRQILLHVPPPVSTSEATNTYSMSGTQTYFEVFLNLNGTFVIFKNAATAEGVASVQDNSIHLLVNASNIETCPPYLSYNARLRFRDA